MTDNEYMLAALELAKRGCGYTSPNPMVGAVIVKDDKIIGQGWHEHYGELHAERNALKNCTASPDGATIYVTLEPCCHYGKTPPCTQAIIESGIKRVVIGSGDPNPLVSGKGIKELRSCGIEVTNNVLRDECDKLNEVFFHYIRTGIPYVVMKYAMTLDGKISTHTGASKWITGEEARMQVQRDRHKYTAIMVGVGTIIADNPMLNCRIPDRKNPVRIICDTTLRTPLNSQVVRTADTIPTIIATCNDDAFRRSQYEEHGCKLITVNHKRDHIDLNDLLAHLGKQNIDSILLEGGGSLNWSALSDRIINKVQTYIAPKLFGGISSKTPIGGIGCDTPQDAFTIEDVRLTKLGEDYLLEGDVKYNVYGNH